MENQNKIKLLKARSFSEVLEDTINFIKNEFKTLGGAILKVLFPIALLNAIFMTISMADLFSMVNDPAALQDANPFSLSMVSGNLGVTLLNVFSYMMLTALVFQYFVLYDEHGPKVPFKLLLSSIWNQLLKIFGYFILMGILLMLGFILLIIPGIYLIPIVSLGMAVLVIENKSIGDAFSRSRELIKDQWWSTFGLFIVASIISGFLGYIFSIPFFIIYFIEIFNMSSNPDEINIFSTNTSLILFGISYFISLLGGYLTYMFSYVVIGFQFYSLKEKKESSSLMQEVQELDHKGGQGNIEV